MSRLSSKRMTKKQALAFARRLGFNESQQKSFLKTFMRANKKKRR